MLDHKISNPLVQLIAHGTIVHVYGTIVHVHGTIVHGTYNIFTKFVLKQEFNLVVG